MENKIQAASVWKNFEYIKFFSSFTIGNIGDWFDFFALQLIFAHAFNASPMALSILLMAYMAPMALFGTMAGSIVDRFDKKYLLMVTDFFSGVLTVGLVLSGNMVLSLVLVFIRSSFVTLNGPAQQAALKYLVTEEQLLAANAYGSLVLQLCKVIGPILGAVIVAVYSPKWCLVINAVSFFVSALILLSLKNIVNVEKVVEHTSHVWRQFKESWHLIAERPLLKTVIQVVACLFIFMMMGFSQVVLLLKYLFPEDPSILGVFMGVSGIGSCVSGIWMSQKKSVSRYGIYLGVSFLLIALNYGLLGVYQAQWGVYPLYFLSFLDGLGFGVAVVLFGYVMQKETPQTHMGRVSGFVTMLQGIIFVLGSLLGGVVVEVLGLRTMFVLVGVACLLVIGFVWMRRKVLRDREPSVAANLTG